MDLQVAPENEASKVLVVRRVSKASQEKGVFLGASGPMQPMV